MKSYVVVLLLTSLQLSSAYHIAFFVPFRVGIFEEKTQRGNEYAHALTIAVDDVNNDPSILPGHNLTYEWTDSTDRLEVLRTMYQKSVIRNVDVFVGPASDCLAPARIAQAFEKPLISYLCQENSPFDKQTYPLFVQTYQNANNQAASALFATLKRLEWQRIGIIYENYTYWKDLKATIDKAAGGDALRIVSEEMVPNYKFFQHYGPDNVELKARNKSLKRLREALNNMVEISSVKIFIVLTSFDVLLDVITEAYELGIAGAEKPHNAFIGFQLDVRKRRDDFLAASSKLFRNENVLNKQDRIKRKIITRDGARSLLLISTAELQTTKRYKEFKEELINRTETKAPFKDEGVFDQKLRPTSPVETANALYDAVYQYARTLHRLHSKNINVTAQAVVDEFRRESYVSIGGCPSQFNPTTGSLEIHLSLLHLEENTVGEDFSEKVKTIGSYKYGNNSDIQLLLSGDGKIEWPWGTEHPADELNCQDDGYECPSANEYETTHRTVAVILSVVLSIILILLIVFIARQWHKERELKRAIWQIDTSDIVLDRKVSTESAFSDDSGVSFQAAGFDTTPRYKQFSYRRCHSTKSNTLDILREESTEECPLNSFATARNTTGHFKGDRVFIKVLPKNVEVTVQLQKELRILRHIQHENLNKFIGLGVETSSLWIVMQLGSKGTLEEVLANQDVSLNYTFVLSLVHDIAKGMTFLHNSDIKSHGNLKSSNCVIDNRWVLKITDYGIPEIRLKQLRYTNVHSDEQKFKDLFWKAPELLRQTDAALHGTQKGDVYSFAIILEEFHTLRPPYSDSDTPAREIIDRILDAEVPPYRPLVIQPIDNAESLLGLMRECWREVPEKRPSFQDIKYDVESEMIRSGLKTDICDNMILLLENYSQNLENVVSERTRQLREEKHKTEALLDRMLPRSVAEQLKKGENVQAESFSSVTIYFSDIVQFTALCAESTPMQVVDLLNDLYLLFDDIIMDYKVYKVETIGDAYMVASGLPMKNGKLHASEISCMALEILENVKSFQVKHKPDHELQVRIGIHTGPVVAGVVGMTMPRYCLFGDTVNTASRMESNGEALRIHISESTKDVLDELGGFYLRQRQGEVYLKGKGNCTTYWLEGASPDVPRCPRKLSKKALKPLFRNAAVRKLSAPFRTRKKTVLSIPRFSVA